MRSNEKKLLTLMLSVQDQLAAQAIQTSDPLFMDMSAMIGRLRETLNYILTEKQL